MDKSKWKKPLRIMVSLLIAIVLFFAGYFLMALLLGLLPVNRSFSPAKEGVTIYVKSNGVHTDIVVPTVSEFIDWRTTFPTKDYPSPIDQAPYLGVGWGDKGFYIETPTWAELKASVALRAAFIPSPTLMHVTYHEQEPQTNEKCRRIVITNDQYKVLISHILDSFRRKQDKFIPISGYSYGKTDTFYEALGSYNMIQTCNMWVVKGLKTIGVRTAVWSPFDKGLLYQLRAEQFN